jgi:hypothetical protein
MLIAQPKAFFGILALGRANLTMTTSAGAVGGDAPQTLKRKDSKFVKIPTAPTIFTYVSIGSYGRLSSKSSLDKANPRKHSASIKT